MFEGQSTGSLEQLFSSPVQHWIESDVSIRSTTVEWRFLPIFVFVFVVTYRTWQGEEEEDERSLVANQSTFNDAEERISFASRIQERSLREDLLPERRKTILSSSSSLQIFQSNRKTVDEFRSSPRRSTRKTRSRRRSRFSSPSAFWRERKRGGECQKRGRMRRSLQLFSRQCKWQLESEQTFLLLRWSICELTSEETQRTNESPLISLRNEDGTISLAILSNKFTSFTSNEQTRRSSSSSCFSLWSFLSTQRREISGIDERNASDLFSFPFTVGENLLINALQWSWENTRSVYL